MTSPLDELRISASEVWKKVLGGDQPSDDELRDIIAYERAAREVHLVEDEVKKNKRAK
jgi:hypothetical protein